MIFYVAVATHAHVDESPKTGTLHDVCGVEEYWKAATASEPSDTIIVENDTIYDRKVSRGCCK